MPHKAWAQGGPPQFLKLKSISGLHCHGAALQSKYHQPPLQSTEGAKRNCLWK